MLHRATEGGALKRRTLLMGVFMGLLAALGFAVPALASTFLDVPAGYPYRAAIEGLASRSVVGGYANE